MHGAWFIFNFLIKQIFGIYDNRGLEKWIMGRLGPVLFLAPYWSPHRDMHVKNGKELLC